MSTLLSNMIVKSVFPSVHPSVNFSPSSPEPLGQFHGFSKEIHLRRQWAMWPIWSLHKSTDVPSYSTYKILIGRFEKFPGITAVVDSELHEVDLCSLELKAHLSCCLNKFQPNLVYRIMSSKENLSFYIITK